jgi:hypothetical protein
LNSAVLGARSSPRSFGGGVRGCSCAGLELPMRNPLRFARRMATSLALLIKSSSLPRLSPKTLCIYFEFLYTRVRQNGKELKFVVSSAN